MQLHKGEHVKKNHKHKSEVQLQFNINWSF